jgi:hypothetical protein
MHNRGWQGYHDCKKRTKEVGSENSMGEETGKLVAQVLEGAWRESPPELKCSAASLTRVVPVLLKTGAGGLAWWRLRDSGMASTEPAARLHREYLLDIFQAVVNERFVIQVITRLQSAGVDALLAKGWAAARLYPERGLRTYENVDLWVRPRDYAAAVEALQGRTAPAYPVDVHQRIRLLESGWDELYDNSRVVNLGEVEVRTLGPEDHLRLLCAYMFDHGIRRPLWLCDLGAALESLSAEFDWDYCLRGKQRSSEWLACAFGLAHQLLGASLEDTPLAQRAKCLPRWLVPTLLSQWGLEEVQPGRSTIQNPRKPSEWMGLNLRWPDPIQATVRVGGPFNGFPRFPFQVAELLSRSLQFMVRLPALLRSS